MFHCAPRRLNDQYGRKRETATQYFSNSLSLLVFKVVLLILFLTINTTIIIIMLILRYAVKYNEQLILTLEEDEFSCKQRLAYKLEQVHNIMQGDAQ